MFSLTENIIEAYDKPKVECLRIILNDSFAHSLWLFYVSGVLFLITAVISLSVFCGFPDDEKFKEEEETIDDFDNRPMRKY